MSNIIKTEKNKLKKRKYKGFTLLETLITMVIVSIVILFISFLYVELVKTSLQSSIRMQARDESELTFELLQKNIKQADPQYIILFDSSGNLGGVRRFNNTTGLTTYSGTEESVYLNPVTDPTQFANEIHILPANSSRWICFAFVKDSTDPSMGYIVKSSSGSISTDTTSPSGLLEHADCLKGSETEFKKNRLVLNSSNVNIKDFSMASYFDTYSGNKTVVINLTSQPTKWMGDETEPTEIVRQLVVSTNKLTF